MPLRLPSAICAALLSSCILSKDVEDPRTDVFVHASSMYVFRGQVMNANGVAQGAFKTRMPLRGDKEQGLTLQAFGNVDLSDETASSDSEAWFPPGHAGKFTEVDLSAAYDRKLGPVQFEAALISYVFPNGTEFPLTAGTFGGERGETKELVLRGVWADLRAVQPFLDVHRDFDEVEGWYVAAGLERGVGITKRLAAELSAHVGFTDESHAEWVYGIAVDGPADGRLDADFFYELDEFTELKFGVGFSTLLQSDLEDWFDTLGIDSTNVWGLVGFAWSI